MTGTIKAIRFDRGFGFVTSNGVDLFFHASVVEGVGFDDLEAGQLVDFDIDHQALRPRACRVAVASRDRAA
jgi:CspA family cold shock protein